MRKKSIFKSTLSIVLVIMMTLSMMSVATISSSAAGIGVDSFKDWRAWELYSRGFNAAGNIIESLGEATGCGEVAKVTSFINNTFFGGDEMDEQLAELQNTCNEILNTVTNMQDVLNSVNADVKEQKILDSFNAYKSAWQNQVMNVMGSDLGKNKFSDVFDAYCEYLSYSSGAKTLPENESIEQYENAYVSSLVSYYANMNNDYFADSKLFDSDAYYKYKMFTSSAVDMGISGVISSMLMNMEPDKNNLSSLGNMGSRFVDLAAQYAYYAYPFSEQQAEFVDMSVESQINVVTTMVAIYQDFLARRAEFYTNICDCYNKAVDFKENNVNADELNEEDKAIYDKITDFLKTCDTEEEKKELDSFVDNIEDNYSTIDKCNSKFSQYYDAKNTTNDYVGLMDKFQKTIEKFFNSDIYLADVKASTTFDEYVRAEDVGVSTLINKNFKESTKIEKSSGNYKTVKADFTTKAQSFHKSVSVKAENGRLVFTPFYVLNVGALASKNRNLGNFDVVEKLFKVNGTVDETHYMSGDYYNLVNGVFSDGLNDYVPVSNTSQLQNIINETYRGAYGLSPASYFSSMMQYSSGKQNYLLLNGSVEKKTALFSPTYYTIPVFNMNSTSGWNSQRISYKDFSGATYSLVLVPKSSEIKSKVDTKIIGDGEVTVSGASNVTVKFNEKVNVSIKAPENYMISSIKAQYHSDESNPDKVTKEAVICKDIESNEVAFDYTVPCSDVTIIVETVKI